MAKKQQEPATYGDALRARIAHFDSQGPLSLEDQHRVATLRTQLELLDTDGEGMTDQALPT